MWKCLKCKEVVEGSSKICRKCGSILEEIVEQAASPPTAATPEGGEGGEPDETVAGRLRPAEVDPAVPVDWLGMVEAAAAEEDSSGAAPWTCSKCLETVPGNFDVCWKCGTARDGSEDPNFAVADADSGAAGTDSPAPTGDQEEERFASFGLGAGEESPVPSADSAPGGAVTGELAGGPGGAFGLAPRHCAKCGSPQVIRGARVVDQGEYSDGRLQVVIFGNPDALLFKDRLFAELKANICGQCGYVELYAADPRDLYEHYLKSRGG